MSNHNVFLMKQKVSEIIDRVCPSIQADGGDIELVDVDENGVVTILLEKTTVPVTFSTFIREFKIRPECACGRCSIIPKIIRDGVESLLKKEILEVTKVESVKQ